MEKLVCGVQEIAPDAVAVTAQEDYYLTVRFENGELKSFDMKPLFSHKAYKSLKDKALFSTATVQYGIVMWNNGLDIDPAWLYEDSVPIET